MLTYHSETDHLWSLNSLTLNEHPFIKNIKNIYNMYIYIINFKSCSISLIILKSLTPHITTAPLANTFTETGLYFVIIRAGKISKFNCDLINAESEYKLTGLNFNLTVIVWSVIGGHSKFNFANSS